MHRHLEVRSVGVVGAAINYGQRLQGVELGPHMLRQHGLLGEFSSAGFEVNDYGDVGSLQRLQSPEAYEHLHQLVLRTSQLHKLSVILGGDHSVALSSVSALLKTHPDLGVIWVDAHGDINTPATSPTGSLHGMPLARLMGLADDHDLPGFSWIKTHLRPQKLVYIGPRNLDPGEKAIIRRLGIKTFTSDDVFRLGMRSVIDQALRHLDPAMKSPIHLSFDLDSVDPTLASATGVKESQGLHLHQVQVLAEAIARSQRLVSMDLVELNPLLAQNAYELSRSTNIFIDLANSLMREFSQPRHKKVQFAAEANRDHPMQDHVRPWGAVAK